MDDRRDNGSALVGDRTTIKRLSEREIAVTRIFNAPARIVFEAWTTPELFMRWWVPKSLGVTLRSCEMDVRTGGTYRLEFGTDAESSWAFFGKYIEVVPPTRLVWTNEEGGENGAISTVTFAENGGKTLLTFSEVYPSKEALDESLGGMEGTPEQFEQLDELLATLGAGRA